mgnify:CR=1
PKQEKITGIEPEIKAITQFLLALLFVRYFWHPINRNIWGIQLNNPTKFKYELSSMLLIPLGSRKFIMLLIKSNKELIKKVKFNLSL